MKLTFYFDYWPDLENTFYCAYTKPPTKHDLDDSTRYKFTIDIPDCDVDLGEVKVEEVQDGE